MNLSSQIGNFEDKTLPELKAQLGNGGSRRVVANRFLSQYLFVVGTGGNDYLLNYFAGDAKNSTTLSEFTHDLVSILSSQLKVKLSCRYDHIAAVRGVTSLVTKITSLAEALRSWGEEIRAVLDSSHGLRSGGEGERAHGQGRLRRGHERGRHPLQLPPETASRRLSEETYARLLRGVRQLVQDHQRHHQQPHSKRYVVACVACCMLSAEASFQVSRRRAMRAASCRRPWKTGEGYCAEEEGVPAAIATPMSSSTGFTLQMLSI